MPATTVAIPKSILSVLDLSPEAVVDLCRRAIEFTRSRGGPQTLRGKTVGVLFRKPSTRTRTAFLVGAARLGATVVQFGPADLQTTTGETPEDTARVLSGYLDLLVMRTNESVSEMKVFDACPGLSVINALSSDEHPTQALTDLTTMLGHFGTLVGIDVLYCGEGNKTAAALALAMSRIRGTRLTLATPAGYGLSPRVLTTATSLAASFGARVRQIHDPAAMPRSVDVVYTSRWQEMGVSKPGPDWKAGFAPFRVTRELMDRVSGHRTVVMHDLPAVREEDIVSEVLDGPASLAWVQARNKLFSAMAAMEACATNRRRQTTTTSFPGIGSRVAGGALCK